MVLKDVLFIIFMNIRIVLSAVVHSTVNRHSVAV